MNFILKGNSRLRSHPNTGISRRFDPILAFAWGGIHLDKELGGNGRNRGRMTAKQRNINKIENSSPKGKETYPHTYCVSGISESEEGE